jgi:hypothetical protein
VEAVADMRALVARVPDKAEAWYLYGDYLFHSALRVAESDWMERALEAFERALELDPGLEVVREHLLYEAVFWDAVSGVDTAEARTLATDFLGRVEGESEVMARMLLAYGLGDREQAAWLASAVDTLDYVSLGWLAAGAEIPYPAGEGAPALTERAFDRMEMVALAEADREQAAEFRYRHLRSAGRSDEADDQLRLIEAAFGARPRWWVEAALYWDGPVESAQTAARQLDDAVAGDGSLVWTRDGRDACVLALWKLRDDDVAFARATAARLRAGSDDADPGHGRNALCALLLDARVAELSGTPDADRLLDELVDALDRGPADEILGWVNLEAAWMLERRGDVGAAARVAAYQRTNVPFPFAASTIYREAGRLAEAAGDREAALRAHRWFLAPRTAVDERFAAEVEDLRSRFPELAAGSAPDG